MLCLLIISFCEALETSMKTYISVEKLKKKKKKKKKNTEKKKKKKTLLILVVVFTPFTTRDPIFLTFCKGVYSKIKVFTPRGWCVWGARVVRGEREVRKFFLLRVDSFQKWRVASPESISIPIQFWRWHRHWHDRKKKKKKTLLQNTCLE